jgi:hypothetical protein
VRRLLVIVIFVTLAGPLAVAQSKGRRAAAAEHGLLDAARQWGEALKNRDQATLDRLLADDFVFTDVGNVFDKAEYVAAITNEAAASGQLGTTLAD